MENSNSASFSSTMSTTSTETTYPITTTHLTPTVMGGSHPPQFSMYGHLSLPSTSSPATSQYYYPVRYQTLTHEGMQLAYNTYPYLQVGQSLAYPVQPFVGGHSTAAVYGVPNSQPHALSTAMEQENAWMTKVARSNRKMARQRSLSVSKNSAGSSSSAHADPRGLIVSSTDVFLQNSNNNNAHRANLYSFCTPDKKVGWLVRPNYSIFHLH